MYAFTCVFDGTVQLVGASVVDAWKTDWYKFSLFKYTGGKEEKQKNGEILRGCPTKEETERVVHRRRLPPGVIRQLFLVHGSGRDGRVEISEGLTCLVIDHHSPESASDKRSR